MGRYRRQNRRKKQLTALGKELKEDEFMKWGAKFELGIPSIDKQHKNLVNMLNKLFHAMQKEDNSAIGNILNELAEYTVYHFQTEEKYFDQYNYPETEEHKKIHAHLVEKVLEFKQKFESGEELLSHELMNFLKDWLTNHICFTDKKYAPFLKEKGVQ